MEQMVSYDTKKATLRDIESSLDAAPNNLQNFGRLLNIGMVSFSADGSLASYDDTICQLLELSPNILETCHGFFDFIKLLADRGDLGSDNPVEIVHLVQNTISEMREHASGEGLKTQLKTPSGRILQIHYFFNDDQSATIAFEDTTEDVLRAETLKAAMRMSGSGYIHYNTDTQKIRYESLYFTDILTPRELTMVKSSGLWPLIHPDDIEKAKDSWRSAFHSGAAQNVTLRLSLQKKNIIWIKAYVQPQMTDNGNIVDVLCFFIDVTETLRAQENLRKSKEALEKALQTKNMFLSRISHEIRTPMNAVIGIADALIHHHGDPAINTKLELIESSAANILRILDETLDHAKIESAEITLEPKLESPRKVVKKVCDLWEEQALRNNVKIMFTCQDSVPEQIMFDPHRFEQCINNLLSNAVKFSQGGEISVVLMTIEADGLPTKLALAVKDTGIGMTSQQQDNIFEAYKQADVSISRRFGGTGLGMNITQSIVEMMGGRISVRSEIGKGSIFVITLPIDIPEQSKGSDTTLGLVESMMERSKPEPTAYEDLRILVVDDNATNHLVVKSLLESMVGEIFVANNGREALDILEVKDVDIVFMDIHMPVMDGIEATIAIRGAKKPWADVRIIALTADPEYQQQRLCMNIGMDFALAKPVKLAEILEAIDIVLNIDRRIARQRKAG